MIERSIYYRKVKPFINKEIIKVFTGMRRSGKSVMMRLVRDMLVKTMAVEQDNCIEINFESPQFAVLKTGMALYEYVKLKITQKTGKIYIFLDEIQEVVDWETCVNAFLVDFNIDIYLTGSNAKLLSGELATYLAGRYVEIVIYPFSFAEMHSFYSGKQKAGDDLDVKSLFMQYVRLGGLPFLFHLDYEPDSSLQYLSDVYNSVILKDVVQRNAIRDIDLLERILLFVVSNVGRIFSAKSVSDYLKNEKRITAPETVYNYLKACENAFLFYRVPREDLIGKKILKTNEKFFLTDHGIREALYGSNERDIERTLENIVYMELLRRGWTVHVGLLRSAEIDFICNRRNEKLYVQVSYVLGSFETQQREFEPLLALRDNFPKMVLSLLDTANLSDQGIIHKNIIDFLINNSPD